MHRKVLLALALLCILSTISATAIAASQKDSEADRFIGTWRLVSIETIRPDGKVIYPFYGQHPEGLLMYDRNGWMSVQIVADPKPSKPSTDSREKFLASPLEEKAAAIDGYYAYFGTWTIDSAHHSIIHHIRESLAPGERGKDGVRGFTFEGDRLTLTAKTHEMGEDHQRKLVWERVPPSP